MAFDLLNRFTGYQTNMAEPVQIQESTQDSQLQAVALQKLMQEIRSQTAGSFLSGELLEVNGKDVKLLLANSLMLNAKLDKELLLSQGESITFQVSGNKNGQLFLRPLFANMGQEQNAMKALDSASIPVNGRTLELVNELMKYQMPVNKEALTEAFRQMNLFPQAEVTDIVMLHKLNLPVNEENVNTMQLYRGNNQQLMPDITQLGEEITNLLLNPETFTGVKEALDFAGQFFEVLTGRQPKSVGGEENVQIFQDKEQMSQGTVQNTIISTDAEQSNLPSIQERLANEIIRLFQITDSKKSTQMRADVKADIVNLLKQEFLMEPEKLSELEYVKKYYENLSDQLSKFEGLMKEAGKSDTAFAKTASQMKSNISFMNQINELYHYVQLPLKMNEASANGDLYVFKRRHAKTDEDGNLTALLHLSMEHLGNMDVFLSLKDNKLSTKFCMEKEELIDFMESHMDLLNQRLMAKGYQISTSVTGKEREDTDVIDNIVNHGQSVTVYSKQSFDARA